MTILNKEKILEQAKTYVDAGRFDKAVKEYEKIMIADPSDLRLKLRVAELNIKRKQVGEAIRLYKEVANSYIEEGFFLKAVTVYKNILRLNPSMIEINEELAHLYEKMGLIDDAVGQYDITASSLEAKAELEKSLEIRKKIVELKPDDVKAGIKLADLYQCLGMMDKSIEESAKLVMNLEKKNESEDQRIDLYEKILSHEPNRIDFAKNLILIYHRRQNKKKALEWLEKEEKFFDGDDQLMEIHADIYASLNQLDSAVNKYYSLVDLKRENDDEAGVISSYLKILMLMPDEKDRIEKEVIEIGAGLWEQLSEKWEKQKDIVAKQQAEFEKEEKKKEEELRIKQEEEEKTRNEKSKKRVVKPQDSSSNQFKEGEAALTLARAYKKMGLKEEFLVEIKKAVSSFEHLKGMDERFPKLKKYLEEIDVLKK